MESHREPKWCCVSSLIKIVTFFAVPFWSMPVLPFQHNAGHKGGHPGSTLGSTRGLRGQRFSRFRQPLQVRAELRRPLIAAALHQALDRAKQFIEAPPGFFVDAPHRAVDADRKSTRLN